jgi:membrane protein YdbS with pleckstrin-like domain
MKLVKWVFISIGALLAALVIVPLTILAGLFVWLKLTEQTDLDNLEIEDTV